VQLAQELLKFIQGLLGFVDATVRETSFLACLDGFSKPLNVTPTPLFRKMPHQFIYFVSRCHSCGDNFMLHPNCLVNVFSLIPDQQEKNTIAITINMVPGNDISTHDTVFKKDDK